MRSILNVKDTNLTVDELLKKVSQSSEPIALGLSSTPDFIAIVIPKEKYEYMVENLDTKQKRAKTPFDYFSEIVGNLRSLEEKYKMKSEDFYRKFQSGLIKEGPQDYFSWRTYYNGYLRMKEHYNFSMNDIRDV